MRLGLRHTHTDMDMDTDTDTGEFLEVSRYDTSTRMKVHK